MQSSPHKDVSFGLESVGAVVTIVIRSTTGQIGRMRNQLARVTLGVFFCVASATAQEHTSSETMLQLGATQAATASKASGLQSSSGGSFHFEDASMLRYSDDAFAVRNSLVHADGSPIQGDDAYTINQLFRQYHGEFMDRYERYDPAMEIRGRFMPNQSVGNEPGSFDMFGYDFDVETPLLITTEAYLKFGLYQYGRHYNATSNFGSANNPGFNSEGSWGDETLTAAGARLGLGWFLTSNFFMEIETNPGLYSDLEGTPNHKDYDFPSSALFTYRPIDNFFFKFGVRYNQIFEDAPWLPYLGFSWEMFEGLRLDLLAPEYIELSWWPSAATAFSFGAEVQGAQYRVRSTSQTGKQRANLQVQEVIAYLGMTHRMSDQLSIRARGGVVLAGDYDLTTGAENFDNAEGALSQSFYADITLGFDW